ncbi:MAG: hypothetical protein MJZ14_04975 [Paludibacteraceae bacterium]|nr:hypothetical protein [Paludibacteraceae bacterium]
MKHIVTLLIGLLLSFSHSFSQTMEQYMGRMIPASTQLNNDGLAKLLALGLANHADAKIYTRAGDSIRLLGYERNNYVLIQTSEQGHVSVKRWQIDDTTQVCGFSSWVCGTMCDGWWRFQTLGNRKIEVPKVDISDFYDKEALAADGWTADSLSSKFEMIFLHCEFGRGDSVYVYCDTERYLEADRRKEYSKYFKGNRVVLLPVEGRFVIVDVDRDEHYNEVH